MNLIALKERIVLSAAFNPEERDFILNAINATAEWQAADTPTIALDPGNYMGRIESIWAWLSLDDGGEGICAAPLQQGMLTVPMIAADKRRMESLRPIAERMVQVLKKPIRLAKFTKREDIEIIRP